MIVGNFIGGLVKNPNTMTLRDVNGTVFTAVLTDEMVNLTSTADDIRKDTVAITKDGVTVGTKEIPAYHTNQGVKIIQPGSEYAITGLDYLDAYDFTKLQVIICAYNTSLSDSVSASKIVLDHNVHEVLSTEIVSTISKNHDDKTIEFGLTNDTDKPVILRYFTYKEME